MGARHRRGCSEAIYGRLLRIEVTSSVRKLSD